MTGDGADELFAGYSYLFDMSGEELREYQLHLYKVMYFSSVDLGINLGIEVKTPYLNQDLKFFAAKLRRDVKIREGYGKWILRKAYEGELPDEIIWRNKVPIEMGVGTIKLKKVTESKIKDENFKNKREEYGREGVKIRNKEQLYYYEIFRGLGIEFPREGEKKCPYCKSALPSTMNYCRTCGAYPV
jgi:asparagine synthase (glutamine-hydrolysing)